MSQSFGGPQITCTACGKVTNTLRPLCPECEATIPGLFTLVPPDVTPPGEDPAFVEQGIRVYQVNDMEWWAGTDKASVIEVCLQYWGGSMDEYFPDGEEDVTTCNLDTNTINTHEECDPNGERMTYREWIRSLIAEGAKFPCFFAGNDY